MSRESGWAEFERAGWERHVDPYHAFFAPISEHVAPAILDAAGVGPGVRTLDVCCGPGYIAGAAQFRGGDAHGLDVAQTMVALAARLYPNVSFRVGDATALPWPDGLFDAVVCSFGVHHLSDPQVGVTEFARVVRTGGRVAFSVWDEDRSGLGVVADAIYGVEPTIPNTIPSPPDLPSYTSTGEVGPLLAAAGLTLHSIETVSWTQRYPSADLLWDGWLAAAIRTRPVLEAQSLELRTKARTAYEATIEKMTRSDGIVEVPIVVQIIAGSRV
jgi:SAM-dependent methyltransferase